MQVSKRSVSPLLHVILGILAFLLVLGQPTIAAPKKTEAVVKHKVVPKNKRTTVRRKSARKKSVSKRKIAVAPKKKAKASKPVGKRIVPNPCPLPVSTVGSKFLKTKQGAVRLEGVSKTCKVVENRQMFIHGNVHLRFYKKPPEATLLVTLIRDKKESVFREIIALKPRGGTTSEVALATSPKDSVLSAYYVVKTRRGRQNIPFSIEGYRLTDVPAKNYSISIRLVLPGG